MVRLIGNCCNNLLFRNSGNDQTYAIGKNNFIHSGEGNDLVTSLGFNNVIVGGQGADTIVNVGKNNLVLGDQVEIPDLSDLTIDLSGLGFDFAIPDLDLSGLGFDFAIPDIDLSGLGFDFSLPDIDLSGLGFDFSLPNLDLSGLSFDFAIPDLDLSAIGFNLSLDFDDIILSAGTNNVLFSGQGDDLTVAVSHSIQKTVQDNSAAKSTENSKFAKLANMGWNVSLSGDGNDVAIGVGSYSNPK